jgi:aminomuconate-semialdehyde/2-hydroxymuconate-6-semialdehyde dehydrogenase
VVTGGGVPDMPGDLAEGAWVQPTIWTGLPETASVVQEEIFGPAATSALRHRGRGAGAGQRHRYGLATTVWTQNLARAHRMAAAIEVGITWINSWFLRDLRTPFGGAKQSGIGREGGCIRWSSTPSCATSA